MSPVMTPMPIDRFLTPEEPIAIPAGFTQSRQELTRGVPFQWPLTSRSEPGAPGPPPDSPRFGSRQIRTPW